MEKIFKGVANHRRIDILALVARRDGVNVENIAEALNCNFKTISAHTHKLVQAGLLQKKYLGQNVLHSLSPQGRKLLSFLQSF